MSRYIRDFHGNINPEVLFNEINMYMLREGYTYMTYKGENLYKKGTGMMSAPTFLKVTITNTSARVEAFIKTAIVPGVYVGESGLDSFYGALPKSVLKTRVEVVETVIMRHIGMNSGGAGFANQEPNFGAQPQQPQPDFTAQPQQPQQEVKFDVRQQPQQPQQTQPQSNFGAQPSQPQTPPQNNFIFCCNCGTKHDKSARFCNNCGYKMQ